MENVLFTLDLTSCKNKNILMAVRCIKGNLVLCSHARLLREHVEIVGAKAVTVILVSTVTSWCSSKTSLPSYTPTPNQQLNVSQGKSNRSP